AGRARRGGESTWARVRPRHRREPSADGRQDSLHKPCPACSDRRCASAGGCGPHSTGGRCGVDGFYKLEPNPGGTTSGTAVSRRGTDSGKEVEFLRVADLRGGQELG